MTTIVERFLYLVLLTRATLAQIEQPIYINCGGGQVEWPAGSGQIWVDDAPYLAQGGGGDTRGTNPDIIYTSSRWFGTWHGPSEYRIPGLENGVYTVILHFSEIRFGSVGARVFDAMVQEQQTSSNIDCIAEAGKNVAVTRTFFNISVTTGSLDIRLQKVVQNPAISAIEILPVLLYSQAPTPTPGLTEFDPIRINCGSTQITTDSEGNIWEADNYFLSGASYQNYQGCVQDQSGIIEEEDKGFLCSERNFNKFKHAHPFSYDIQVPNGQVSVELVFAEIYFSEANKRKFDVYVEDKLLFGSLDIFVQTGAKNQPFVLTTTAVVRDGSLTVTLEDLSGFNNPKINGIAVLPTADTGPTLAPVTQTPETTAPTALAPVAAPVSTTAPITPAPVTSAPTTLAPVKTPAPTTPTPTTSAPTVLAPVTTSPGTATPTAALTASPTSSINVCGLPQFTEDTWASGTNYPIQNSESQGGMIGKWLVIAGGFHEPPDGGIRAATNKSWKLDTSDPTANWIPNDDLPDSLALGVTHGSTVIVGDKLYICGGYLGGHPGPHVPDCVVYDNTIAAGNGQWTTLPTLPDGRAGGGMIYDTTSNSLVFAGGAERPNPSHPHAVDYQHTWKLNLGNIGAGWQTMTDIPYLANHMSYVTVRDSTNRERHIFVGGQVGEEEKTGNVSDNYEYVVATDTWIKLADMPIPRGHSSSSTRAMGCGFWIAAGTTNDTGKIKDVSFYDIELNTWTHIGETRNPINTPVCDFSPHSNQMYCETGWSRGFYSTVRGFELVPY